MSGASRRKGVGGEKEVADAWRAAGATVRGLEGAGDHLVICTPHERTGTPENPRLVREGVTIHSEVKRAERLKIPEWWRQTVDEAPRGTVPVLHHRQNRGEWLVTLRLDDLAALVTT